MAWSERGDSLPRSTAACQSDDLVLIEAGRDRDARQGRLPHRQRAGLVEHDGIDLFKPFQRLGVADQHTGAGAGDRPRP